MKWGEKELKTMGDIMGACTAILKLPEPEGRVAAKLFMDEYFEETPNAFQNIGYMSGYYDDETMAKIQDWFQTSHPIFGRSKPTPEQAFEAGKKWGESVRAKEQERQR